MVSYSFFTTFVGCICVCPVPTVADTKILVYL